MPPRYKDKKFGLTRSTEQAKRLQKSEQYATTKDEIRQMERNVGRNRVRDQLVIRTLWQTGIRRGEASLLKIGDIDRDEREIEIREAVAKNNQKRIVAYQQSLDGLLKEWPDHGHREEMAATADHDRFFVGERGAPLSGDRINNIFIDAANEARIDKKIYADANAPRDEDGNRIPNRWKISAHNIRHGFGS